MSNARRDEKYKHIEKDGLWAARKYRVYGDLGYHRTDILGKFETEAEGHHSKKHRFSEKRYYMPEVRARHRNKKN